MTNKERLVQAVEAWNEHDLDAYMDLYSEDLVLHGFPPAVEPTKEGLKGFFAGLFEAVPDARVTPINVVAEDDVVAAHFTISGTHEGELLGAPPTGNAIDVDVMSFFRFGADGRVSERWLRMDEATFLAQIGLVPVPA
jgi:steroid delta-isomerase-like uncharacterized protein